MDRTAELDLPLVQASQAQKHVTVNEALVRLDGLVQLTVQALDRTDPPADAADGAVYAVPAGATGDWASYSGQLAIRDNGGWSYATPRAGWRGWLAPTGDGLLFDGTDWVVGGQAASPFGAVGQVRVVETEVDTAAGGSVTTSAILPAYGLLLGVSGVVVQAITGASAWRVGLPGSGGKFGTGIGGQLGSWINGPTVPEPIWSPTGLLVEAEGGSFSGGRVRLSAHIFSMTPPRVS